MRAAVVSLAAAGLLMLSAAPATSQESSAVAKDPAIALGFAWLCPGCGHLYSGETTKGALIAVVSIGSVATGAAIQLTRSWRPAYNDDCRFSAHGSACFERGLDLTPILVGSAVGLAGYLYGLIDARSSARRMNARNGIGFGDLDVKPAVTRDGSVGAEFRVPLPLGR
jgi:hypothetical protein